VFVKSRILRLTVGTAFLAGFGGQAMAQCAAGTQVTGTGTVESTAVTFSGLVIQNVNVGGLQLGCLAISAANVAAFFDNLPNGSAGPTAPALCTKSGTLSGRTSGAISGTSTVTFTASPATLGNVPDLSVTGTFTSAVTTQGAPTLNSLLNLSLVCGRPGGSYPGSANDRWQEQHRASSQLWDYKQGASTVDPTKQVGTWGISGSVVTHTYGSSPFSWTVHNNGTFYSFCTNVGGSEHVRAFISTPGSLATANCGGTYPP